eukprot:TRINITY_DN58457_c0_g1_i1.p1 TRINITY_DN58457_c0_g1~~TRINITY_DN58457_c0_g1_i1.p1  ORF type:complete len:198 (-),score=32.68 TRINITY_DN58457_c0_g1_i1:201-794(-)
MSMQTTSNMAAAKDISWVLQHDLLIWSNPIRSTFVLGVVDGVFLIYFFTTGSAVWLASECFLATIVAGGVAKMAGVPLGNGYVDIVSEDSIEAVVRKAGLALNQALDFLRQVCLWEHQTQTLTMLGCFYVLNCISGLVSIAVVTCVAANLLFVVPFAIVKQKPFIDSTVQPQWTKAMKKKDELLGMIPTYRDVYKAN